MSDATEFRPGPRAPVQFMRSSRPRGYAQVLGNIAALLALLALASAAKGVWLCTALYLLIGCAQHRLFFPAHDCLHYSLFPTRAENRICGIVLAGLMGTPFDSMRVQHLDHHRAFGQPSDPGAPDYFVRFESRPALLRFLFAPLVGGVFLKKLPDYWIRSTGASRQAPDSASHHSQSGMARTLIAGAKRLAPVAAAQLGVLAILSHGFVLAALWRYPVFYVLPLTTVFLFFIRLRMFLEHGSIDYQVCDYLTGRRPTTRSIHASAMERIFLCGSDFNYHHEHHRFPSVPGWQLPSLHAHYAASYEPHDTRASYRQAFMELWGNLPWRPVRADSVGISKLGAWPEK